MVRVKGHSVCVYVCVAATAVLIVTTLKQHTIQSTAPN